jgi:hypothetical protein
LIAYSGLCVVVSVTVRILFFCIAVFLMFSPASSQPLEFSGRTLVFYGGGHGIQVEYYARNGRSYLWYPGNSRSVRGQWKNSSGGSHVCFRYPANTYDPVKNKQLGDWNCKSKAKVQRMAKSTCKGDPFRLSSGKVPYALKRGRGQLGQIKEKCS